MDTYYQIQTKFKNKNFSLYRRSVIVFCGLMSIYGGFLNFKYVFLLKTLKRVILLRFKQFFFVDHCILITFKQIYSICSVVIYEKTVNYY